MNSENIKRGRLVVVSGPSGVGKGTVLKILLENQSFVYSVSATTRSAREGEKDGVNYHFVKRETLSFSYFVASDKRGYAVFM